MKKPRRGSRGLRERSRQVESSTARRSRILRTRSIVAAILVLATVGITLVLPLYGEKVLAFLSDEATPADDLSGLVIRPDEIPLDERGRPRPDLVLDLPGPEPIKPEIKERLDELQARYDEEATNVPTSFFATRLAPLSDEANAPPRMDSGDPNPDRIIFDDASENP